MISFFKKIWCSHNEHLLKKYRKLLTQINELEHSVSILSDEALKSKTDEYRLRYKNGDSLEALLPEAFSVVRETSKRILGMRQFDVQVLGGIALHNGKISEMRTGEGKTLMATMPAYLNALSGKGVHIVTVNEYLAKRDAEWMGRLYNFLKIDSKTINSQQSNKEKRIAYNSDITYGTNNEFGFDYLRDNMEYFSEDRRQRSLTYAIIDEVDSILIDEARTPLIISGHSEDNIDLYIKMNVIPSMLTRMISEPKLNELEPFGDFWVDEKNQQVFISEMGHEHVESILTNMNLLPKGESLYDSNHIVLMHHLITALRAHTLFQRNQHYVVKDGKVIIVDEFTGRLMIGRRWSDGIHQAIEAKEGVKIQNENKTLASITFQNYFRMYENLSGMTGTASTESYEFQEIYDLETVVIPTNKSMIRHDQNDQVFKTKHEKYDAIINDIKDCYQRGQPVLVGTTNIENSELLSILLRKAKLPHEVLNAKYHEKEAIIIAEAGKPFHITIATNMAGRGTDIVLGGNIDRQINMILYNEKLSQLQKKSQIKNLRLEWKSLNEQVKKTGGLRIIGTERHESRRIDNQLRGRSGRQGDPGSSRFYLSLDDSLMRIFAGDKLRNIMNRLKLPIGEPIESSVVNRAIETAQRKVENRNFDIRKQLLEYDDISNEQRKILYKHRNDVLDATSVRYIIDNLLIVSIKYLFHSYISSESIKEEWNIEKLVKKIKIDWNITISLDMFREHNDIFLDDQKILEKLQNIILVNYQKKIDWIGVKQWDLFERSVLLQCIDTHWQEHLSSLDYLRQGIHLRGYAQKNPKQEYKREAFELFEDMLCRIRNDVIQTLMRIQIKKSENFAELNDKNLYKNEQSYQIDNVRNISQSKNIFVTKRQIVAKKIGRNEQCPCGSGKKFKYCHGLINLQKFPNY